MPKAAPAARLPRALMLPLLAFAVGALAFALLWLGKRGDGGDAVGAAAPAAAVEHDPLPAPPARGEAVPAPGDTGAGEIVPAPPMPSADIARRPAPDAPVADVPGTASGADPAAVAVADRPPLPVEAPPPRYPRDALRRGEAGDVLLRVRVDADGVPVDVNVARGSGSRQLDRAAVDAVRRWRFRPALRAGAPAEAEIRVPIRFQAG